MQIKNLLTLLLTLTIFSIGFASDLPPVLQEVLRRDTAYTQLNCTVGIKIDIPGIMVPEKEVQLEITKGEAPKIDGEGILFLPKRGFAGQYAEMLTAPLQAINMGNKGDTLIYKLVSLDESTDWVTADVFVNQMDTLVYKTLLTTRQNGSFKIFHNYAAHSSFPRQTKLYFKASPIKLPLKFLGQNDGDEGLFNADQPIEGKVELNYRNVQVE